MADILADTKLIRVGFYFAVLIASLLCVLWKIIEVTKSAERVCRKLFVLPIIALLSLAVTWLDIYNFIKELSKNYPDLKSTLKQDEVVVTVGMSFGFLNCRLFYTMYMVKIRSLIVVLIFHHLKVKKSIISMI